MYIGYIYTQCVHIHIYIAQHIQREYMFIQTNRRHLSPHEREVVFGDHIDRSVYSTEIFCTFFFHLRAMEHEIGAGEEQRRWQIKKRIFSKERWLDMDDWFAAQTEVFFRQYQRECREYIRNAQEMRFEPFNNIYEESHTSCPRADPVTYRWDFTGLCASKYYLKNMRSGEENEIRLIRYQVLEPRFTEESLRFQ